MTDVIGKVDVYIYTQITNWSKQPTGYSAIYQFTDHRSFSWTTNEKLRLLWSAMLMANRAYGAEITSHNFLAHSEFPQGMLSYPSSFSSCTQMQHNFKIEITTRVLTVAYSVHTLLTSLSNAIQTKLFLRP